MAVCLQGTEVLRTGGNGVILSASTRSLCNCSQHSTERLWQSVLPPELYSFLEAQNTNHFLAFLAFRAPHIFLGLWPPSVFKKQAKASDLLTGHHAGSPASLSDLQEPLWFYLIHLIVKLCANLFTSSHEDEVSVLLLFPRNWLSQGLAFNPELTAPVTDKGRDRRMWTEMGQGKSTSRLTGHFSPL